MAESNYDSSGGPLDEIARFIGTGAFTGYAPVASGTFGTIPAVLMTPALAALAARSTLGYLAVLLASIGLSIWAAGRCQHIFQEKDCGKIVADEIVGFFVTMAFLPVDLPTLVVGFLAFRLFDIVKPAPARQFEALPGGLGVVADDLMAGVYANLVVRAVLYSGLLPTI